MTFNKQKDPVFWPMETVDFHEQEAPYFQVVRTHSHTDKQCLWKVVSRPFIMLEQAKHWMEYEKSQERNKKHKFTIVKILTEWK